MIKIDIVDTHENKMVVLYEGTFEQFKDIVLFNREKFLQEDNTGYYIMANQIVKFKERN